MSSAWQDRIVRLERRPAGELAAHPQNWRRHPEAQRKTMQAAANEVGLVAPLVENLRSEERGWPAGSTPTLIDGHLRLELALERGEAEQLPVVVVDLTEREEVLALASLDPIGAQAEADPELLAALLEIARPESPDLGALLEGLVGAKHEPPADPGPQVDRAAELQEKWATETGQIWVIGDHRLMCGDSTSAEDVERLMAGERADMGVTSPPYNQGIDKFKPSGMHKEADWVPKVGRLAYSDSMPEKDYQAAQVRALSVWHGAIKDGGSLFYNHKNRYRDKQVISPLAWLPGPFRLRQEIVWSRPGSVTQNARMLLPSDERIFWMYRGADFYFDDQTEIKSWSTVWRVALETNKDHAVGFPVELPRRCILACSRPGEIVFEPYAGSGTTIVAAEQEARQCLSMEISPGYVATCLERLAGMGLSPEMIAP